MTTITMILMGIAALVSALISGVGMHALGKSAGKKEGTQEAETKQAETQHSAQFEAITQRLDADAKAAATPDADLDRKLSEFDRKG